VSRSEALAVEFERVNRELVDYVRGLDRERWLTPGVNSPIIQRGDEDENRPVGTIVHHVAMGYRRSVEGLRMLTAGEQLPAPSRGTAARHAAEHAEPDQAGTVALLEEGAAAVAAGIRALTDEQLDADVTTFLGSGPLSEVIERAIIFHPVWHLSSIRATFEPAARSS
jgi:hypothetical protein